jgi:hypothetical protein
MDEEQISTKKSVFVGNKQKIFPAYFDVTCLGFEVHTLGDQNLRGFKCQLHLLTTSVSSGLVRTFKNLSSNTQRSAYGVFRRIKTREIAFPPPPFCGKCRWNTGYATGLDDLEFASLYV